MARHLLLTATEANGYDGILTRDSRHVVQNALHESHGKASSTPLLETLSLVGFQGQDASKSSFADTCCRCNMACHFRSAVQQSFWCRYLVWQGISSNVCIPKHP
jgi:hypothetical protein